MPDILFSLKDILPIGQQINTQIISAVQEAIIDTLLYAKDEWQSQAQNKLNSTLQAYLSGLSITYPNQQNPNSGYVELQGKFPNMLEAGFPAYDIKTAMPKSKRVKKTKNGGWYMTIPLRHSTPGSFMYGPAMTKQRYNQVKKLENKGRISVSGGQLTSWTGYTHKSNLDDNLTRIIKQYPKKRQSQYMTFRRISNNSSPNSWIHPGYQGTKIVPAIQHEVEKELELNIARAFSACL